MLHKFLRFCRRFLLPVFRQNRHKSLRKRPFGKNTAQQVGQAEGHHECIHRNARAENPRQHRIAHKTEHPRQHGHAADFRQRAKKVHALLPIDKTGASVPQAAAFVGEAEEKAT